MPVQVAERQGKYLAKELNRMIKDGGGHAGNTGIVESPPFVYKHLGSMASVGRYKALVDLRQSKVRFLPFPNITLNSFLAVIIMLLNSHSGSLQPFIMHSI